MAIHCEDIETLVHSYLDGELAEHELHELETHLAECQACREHAEAEARFLDGLRTRLAAPPCPDTVRARLGKALDAEDRSRSQAARRARFGWVLPGTASVAAAAALVLFVAEWRAEPEPQPVTYEAVRQHIRRPPLEVQGAGVTPFIEQHFRPRVALPRFSEPSVRLQGARLSHLRGRDAAQLFYEVRGHSGARHDMQVHIVDAADLELPERQRRVVGGRVIWVDPQLGYSTVTYRDEEGLAYVFTSDMEATELVRLVVSSDLLMRVNERLLGR